MGKKIINDFAATSHLWCHYRIFVSQHTFSMDGIDSRKFREKHAIPLRRDVMKIF